MSWPAHLVDLVLPRRCVGCGAAAPGHGLCPRLHPGRPARAHRGGRPAGGRGGAVRRVRCARRCCLQGARPPRSRRPAGRAARPRRARLLAEHRAPRRAAGSCSCRCRRAGPRPRARGRPRAAPGPARRPPLVAGGGDPAGAGPLGPRLGRAGRRPNGPATWPRAMSAGPPWPRRRARSSWTTSSPPGPRCARPGGPCAAAGWHGAGCGDRGRHAPPSAAHSGRIGHRRLQGVSAHWRGPGRRSSVSQTT